MRASENLSDAEKRHREGVRIDQYMTGEVDYLETDDSLYEDEDPTPQYLWDHSGGEPPVTLNEMHHNAWLEKLKNKS